MLKMASLPTIICSDCESSIKDTFYMCETCENGFRLCDECYSAKNRKHPHTLVSASVSSLEPADDWLFEYAVNKTPLKGTIHLTNVFPVLRSSEELSKRGITAVLSILDEDEIESMDSLNKIYGKEAVDPYKTLYRSPLEVVVKDETNGILYYNFRIADVSNPAILSKPAPSRDGSSKPALTPDQVFSRLVSFISAQLTVGTDSSKTPSVVVHCKQGRRRSPTAILAFLVTQGMRTHQALQLIGATYAGEKNWADSYKQHRTQWLAALSSFESKSASLLEDFKIAQPKLMKAYIGQIWTDADELALEQLKTTKQTSNMPNMKKRELPEPEKKIAAPSPKKYKLASATPLTPSLWAKRAKN